MIPQLVSWGFLCGTMFAYVMTSDEGKPRGSYFTFSVRDVQAAPAPANEALAKIHARGLILSRSSSEAEATTAAALRSLASPLPPTAPRRSKLLQRWRWLNFSSVSRRLGANLQGDDECHPRRMKHLLLRRKLTLIDRFNNSFNLDVVVEVLTTMVDNPKFIEEEPRLHDLKMFLAKRRQQRRSLQASGESTPLCAPVGLNKVDRLGTELKLSPLPEVKGIVSGFRSESYFFRDEEQHEEEEISGFVQTSLRWLGMGPLQLLARESTCSRSGWKRGGDGLKTVTTRGLKLRDGSDSEGGGGAVESCELGTVLNRADPLVLVTFSSTDDIPREHHARQHDGEIASERSEKEEQEEGMRKLHHSKPQVGKHVQHVKALIAQLQQSIVLDEDDDTRHTWCAARLPVVFDPGDKVAAFGTLVAEFGTMVARKWRRNRHHIGRYALGVLMQLGKWFSSCLTLYSTGGRVKVSSSREAASNSSREAAKLS
ncbi:hypothetical protein SELMODRAFT_439365 [Selaginella moellendorffii]|uniref:Uncharacterized protein n=1 Tax=Selaginella moellendorffii TaxID=88036 RepID=D8R3W3_SELML|nr:hypothetical protein SELMODRAFT_439365 [Selaginella moellendorffii]